VWERSRDFETDIGHVHGNVYGNLTQGASLQPLITQILNPLNPKILKPAPKCSPQFLEQVFILRVIQI